ncbi:MAG: dTDP-4-dehydrorhamnose 3,5-epimerase [Betaproteobacteria bacterium]|nr:dTDP-4-dehydrorhamnose 3,5-epimerase [Betaproteobacteria bacterium]NDE53629.1 dTDP-4-dehydrorhamnose 3,5-epimerase [Actinomycetota bacterium]
MKVTETSLHGVLLIEPKVFADSRGFFLESWNERVFRESTGVDLCFVQDNHSRSAKGVLRGLHYQCVHPQGKLVRVSSGRVWDVVVDLRLSSASFAQHIGIELSEDNQRQLWIPPGFAHGFLVLSDFADFQYKTTTYWMPQHERSLRWNDPSLGILWPDLDASRGNDAEHVGESIRLAEKDREAPFLDALKAQGALFP